MGSMFLFRIMKLDPLVESHTHTHGRRMARYSIRSTGHSAKTATARALQVEQEKRRAKKAQTPPNSILLFRLVTKRATTGPMKGGNASQAASERDKIDNEDIIQTAVAKARWWKRGRRVIHDDGGRLVILVRTQ